MMGSKGFSIIELMIGMAIIGIMATIGASSFKKYSARANLKAAAREIASDFTTFRLKAKSEGRIYTLSFSASPNNYTISAPAAGALGAFNLVKTPSTTYSGVLITGADFTGCNTVRITQRALLAHCAAGATPAPQNNTGTVSLINSSGSTAIVTINTTVKTYVNFP